VRTDSGVRKRWSARIAAAACVLLAPACVLDWEHQDSSGGGDGEIQVCAPDDPQCNLLCSNASCNAECAASTSCGVVCNGAHCHVDCAKSECGVLCNGDDCTVDCSGTKDCGVTCLADCTLICPTGCKQTCITGGECSCTGPGCAK
jgi:hypothetical protein